MEIFDNQRDQILDLYACVPNIYPPIKLIIFQALFMMCRLLLNNCLTGNTSGWWVHNVTCAMVKKFRSNVIV